MLSDRDVQELLHYKPSHPVLSIYLNIDPAEGNADAYKLRLRTMLKDIEMPEDVEAILHYFEHEHDWSGRSVAVFSCAPQGFFKAYPLAVAIRRVAIEVRADRVAVGLAQQPGVGAGRVAERQDEWARRGLRLRLGCRCRDEQ